MKSYPLKRLLVIAITTFALGLISFFAIMELTVEDPLLEKKIYLARAYRLSVVGAAIREFYTRNHRLPESFDEILKFTDEDKKALLLSKKREESYSWFIIGKTESNPLPGETNRFLICRVIQFSAKGKRIMTKIYIEISPSTRVGLSLSMELSAMLRV